MVTLEPWMRFTLARQCGAGHGVGIATGKAAGSRQSLQP